MALNLIFGNHLEDLAASVADSGAGLGDAIRKEVIVVSNSGIRRWLTFRLASRRGICANCEFPTVYGFIQTLMDSALGMREEPWFEKSAMTWWLFEKLKTDRGIRDLAAPLGYVAQNGDLAGLQLARRIADLFYQYLTYRPDWIAAWEAGKYVTDEKSPARQHEKWQRRLWRDLAGKRCHRARLYQKLITRLAERPVDNLPSTITVFGIHTLPPVFLKILKALAVHHEVSAYFLHPTAQRWGGQPTNAAERKAFQKRGRYQTEACPDGIEGHRGNELVTSWGGQGRDLFNLLIDEDAFSSGPENPLQFRDPEGTSILSNTQRSIYHLNDRVDWSHRNDDDDSIRIHCCHHPLREVEVLHDCLLDFFRKDPSLTPDDILVLAPDIQAYAPYVDIVFANPEAGVPRIPYSIADRIFTQHNRVADTFFRILEFSQGRFNSSDLYALLQTPTFRDRFGWDDQELARIRLWLSETTTVWGRDAQHRKAMGLPEFNENSWQATVEKLFLGYAMLPSPDDDDTPSEYYHKVEGQDRFLIGKLVEVYKLLAHAAEEFAQPMPVAGWADKIESAVMGPFFQNSPAAAYEIRQIRSGLQTLRDAASALSVSAGLPAIADFLQSVIEDGIPARGFLGSGVTFGSLTPMRAVPHKIVCLIGMQHDAFPHTGRHPGFDLMQVAGMKRTGDRSTSQRDRYLFLETILSARQKLHISYSGLSPRTDSTAPPSLVVGELLSFLKKGQPPTDPAVTTDASGITVRHRLHGHHSDYFSPSLNGTHFSYSDDKCKAAQQWQKRFQRTAKQKLKNLACSDADAPPSNKSTTTIALHDLTEFFLNPAQAYCVNSLHLRIPYNEKQLTDDEPLTMDPLSRYGIWDAVIARKLDPATPERSHTRPPCLLGNFLLDSEAEAAAAAFDRLKEQFPQLKAKPQTVDIAIKLKLEDNRPVLITGTVGNIFNKHHLRFRPGTLNTKDRIQAWILHLALCCNGAAAQTHLFDRNISRLSLPKIPKQTASDHLRKLVALYMEGMRRPLAYALDCSQAYAQSKDDPKTAYFNAIESWYPSDRNYNPPSKDPWMILCWRNQVPFEAPYTKDFKRVAQAVFVPMLKALGIDQQ